jgi:hypothetical protein
MLDHHSDRADDADPDELGYAIVNVRHVAPDLLVDGGQFLSLS